MAEKEESLYKKQKEMRPKIEDVLPTVIEGERLKNALDFVVFLRANKMPPAWASANSWSVSYKNVRVCYIRTYGTQPYHRLDAGCWHISPNGDYTQDIEMPGDLKEAAWAGVRHCASCSHCGPGRHTRILGREFDNVCHQSFTFTNPDTVGIECAKKLVKIRMVAIASAKK